MTLARQPLLWTCMLIALVALPLALGLVPVNPVYGIRTATTRASDSAWYSANLFAGIAMLAAAATSAALLWRVPAAARTSIACVLFATPLALGLVASLVRASRLG